MAMQQQESMLSGLLFRRVCGVTPSLGEVTPILGGVTKQLFGGVRQMTETMPFVRMRHMTETALQRLQTQEDQHNIFSYSIGISVVSPAFNLYQVCKLYKTWPKSATQGARMVAWLYPQQLMLRVAQVNMATVCKDHLDTWVGFAALGVLQGGVYGHATVDFARRLGVGSAGTMDLRKIFRGSIWAAGRDIISQGMPFMFSGYVQDELDKAVPASVPSEVTRWTAVGICSVTSTYLSHGMHTLATAMQANQNLTYRDVLPKVYQQHGMSFMWSGVQGRIALLLATNVFNEQFLKPVWQNKPACVLEIPQVESDGLVRRMSTRSVATLFRLQHQQDNIFSYSVGISFFSPTFNLYQVCKLYKTWPKSAMQGARMVAWLYPQQVMLRVAQVNMATVCKDNLDTWVGFAALGVLQGGVYGHATMDFARRLGVGSAGTMDLRKIFRGSIWAAGRDIISQGMPFMFSGYVQDELDKVLPASVPSEVTRWTAVGICSVTSTYLSHGMHTLATAMQANENLTYRDVLPRVYQQHGMSFMWTGVQGRIVLLLATNIFNEQFLKPVWQNKRQ